MVKVLREYQQQGITETWEALKKNDDPVLFVMSVGGGKSLCISSILEHMEKLGKKALCLVNNSELVRNNSETFKEQGGNPSVFCATLNKKEYKTNIVFATPQSVINAIKTNHPLSEAVFNMIVVDEAHGIDYNAHQSTFMRILRHYKGVYPEMRVLGLTGSDFRGKGFDIVGENCLFKSRVANITTSWLIANGYLAKPTYGITKTAGYDFSKIKPQSTGKFKTEDLERVINKNFRLTGQILQEVQDIMTDRAGAFIFCSTRKHCEESMQALPSELTRIITGETPGDERHEILTAARAGKIKYLLSVNCLMVGIDVPNFCTTVWLRPTESLVIYVQGIGRALRLHADKSDALILDFSGNLDRFQDWDDAIINEAIQPKTEEEQDYCIPCYTCHTLNKVTSRRCCGMPNNKRCDYYFEWKDCPSCKNKNDITARSCVHCQAELIDPNAKLSRDKKIKYELIVTQAKYWIALHQATGTPIINAEYKCVDGKAYESYFTHTPKNKNIFYAKFVKTHLEKASDYYMSLGNYDKLKTMIESGLIKTPRCLICTRNEYGRYEIFKKMFF